MSESRLVPCAGCGRHIVAGEACPFCGQPGEPLKGGYGFGTRPADGSPLPSPGDERPRLSAPRYGMPPLSPTHPGGLLVWVVLAALVAVSVLVYLGHLRR